MKNIAFFDSKPYDKVWFEKLQDKYDIKIRFFEEKLAPDTAFMSGGFDGVVAFVNDTINSEVIETLYKNGINIIAMRCAGYNNIDLESAYGKVHIARVPVYSPYAVAEHATALLLTLNRKIHRAYIRTRDNNFNIDGLTGFDLHGKTVGVIGTGKIGQAFINICKGFGTEVIAFDPYPDKSLDVEYTELADLFGRSDIISLHCPLTNDTHNIINEKSISMMKDGVYIINTSRGPLINSEDLLEAIKSKKVGAAGLDVYDEESDLFFKDLSGKIINDDTLARLISMPNVIVTSHQAFLTNEALRSIAEVTLENLYEYFNKATLKNEICYKGRL
ncbi:MAG: 2-hydroxyacid dehydrogenase [Oscillospiraceae bacterium]